jgi:DNA-binding LacI/PurR family transcriptional regulator
VFRKKAPSKGVTIRDVASAAGISTATVSNAFNRPDQLSSRLQRRIFKVAKKLGYTGPNPAARHFRLKRSGTIGVMFDARLRFAFADSAACLFLQGIAQATEEEGLGLTLLPYSTDSGERTIREALVDGFIVYAGASDDPRIDAVIARQLPMVFVDHSRDCGLPEISIDHRQGAYIAARHLLELRHRRICVITFKLNSYAVNGFVSVSDQNRATFYPARERLRGYQDAVIVHGLDWEKSIQVYQAVHTDFDGGRMAVRAMEAEGFSYTAILAASDNLALGALHELRSVGRRVPQEVSVVGFDDIPEAQIMHPALTTIRQEHKLKGLLAGRKLVGLIRKKPGSDDALLPKPHLILRESTTLAPPGKTHSRHGSSRFPSGS